MKKILLSLLTTLFLFSPAFAANIEVLPTMQSKTNVQDRVWVGTFQLVWNEFMDKITFCPIKFPNGTPAIVNELNQQAFTADALSSKCYYTYTGVVKKNTKKTILKDIRKKFKETSDILDKLDLIPSKDKFIVYAMLKKDFKFANAFDKLGVSNFRDTNAEFFGIKSSSSPDLDKEVDVLFYNNPSDFAIKINTEGSDEVYLYKTANTKPFNYIYNDMLKKEASFKGNKSFAEEDLLKIPNLKFSEEKVFDEISGNRVKGTNIVIDKAIETVKFEMDNNGVKLKSEAAMIAKLTALRPDEISRHFFFDDTFILFLKEKGKNKPYFALRVHNIQKFQ